MKCCGATSANSMLLHIRSANFINYIASLVTCRVHAHHHKGMGSGDNIIVLDTSCMDLLTHLLKPTKLVALPKVNVV